jgi:hypothetical protein
MPPPADRWVEVDSILNHELQFEHYVSPKGWETIVAKDLETGEVIGLKLNDFPFVGELVEFQRQGKIPGVGKIVKVKDGYDIISQPEATQNPKGGG